jgi:hypothetical protein
MWVPRSGLYQAVADAETAVGLATVGLAVTYVLTAFDTLASLNKQLNRPLGPKLIRLTATRTLPHSPAATNSAHVSGGAGPGLPRYARPDGRPGNRVHPPA